MKEAFLNLIEKHQAIVYKVCKMYRDTKEDQEDLFQDILLQLWRAYPGYRGEAKVTTWMYRVALNTAISSIRKKRVPLDYREALPVSMYSNDDKNDMSNKELLFEALRQLNNTERAIIALFFDGYSYKEIGEFIGITENNVGVKMSRIKERLKKKLT
ncbi:MAG: sigma-70 family RNA polymerase sigma factor [Bacteroidota bacterium]